MRVSPTGCRAGSLVIAGGTPGFFQGLLNHYQPHPVSVVLDAFDQDFGGTGNFIDFLVHSETTIRGVSTFRVEAKIALDEDRLVIHFFGVGRVVSDWSTALAL